MNAERITTTGALQPRHLDAADPLQEAKDWLDSKSVQAAAERGLSNRDAQGIIRCLRAVLQRYEREKERADGLAEMAYGEPRGQR